MANPNWYKNNLPDVLYPQGNATEGPLVIPDVLDSDGNEVFFTDPRRFVSQVTGVDVGDSPNSNTGDPLRTAFVKIDNIVEALYRVDAAKNYRFEQLEEPGRFLGILGYSDLATTFLPPPAGTADPTQLANSFNFPQPGDWCILRDLVQASGPSFDSDYYLISRRAPYSRTIINPGSNLYSAAAYSVLRWTRDAVMGSAGFNKSTTLHGVWGGQWVVYQQEFLDDYDFNIGRGLARLATGSAYWGPSTNAAEDVIKRAEQIALYESFNAQGVATQDSKRIQSRNFEDAITELVARATVNVQDAGYYG